MFIHAVLTYTGHLSFIRALAHALTCSGVVCVHQNLSLLLQSACVCRVALLKQVEKKENDNTIEAKTPKLVFFPVSVMLSRYTMDLDQEVEHTLIG
jgi:hypothetical protein